MTVLFPDGSRFGAALAEALLQNRQRRLNSLVVAGDRCDRRSGRHSASAPPEPVRPPYQNGECEPKIPSSRAQETECGSRPLGVGFPFPCEPDNASPDQPYHGARRMGVSPDPFGVVGRLVLLQRARRRRPAAPDRGRRRPRHRRRIPLCAPCASAAPVCRSDPAPLGRLRRHGHPQQRRPVHADRLGAGHRRQRTCLDPQRHHAAVHRPRRPRLQPRRAHDPGERRRRPHRLRRAWPS